MCSGVNDLKYTPRLYETGVFPFSKKLTVMAMHVEKIWMLISFWAYNFLWGKYMSKSITDIELSRAISDEVFDYYVTALDFINSNPDYSLLKFREVVDSIVSMLAYKKGLEFDSKRIFDRINFLFECQLISNPLKDNLHIVRKLGNSGVHKSTGFDGDKEFYESRKRLLVDSANKAREKVVSILGDFYCIIYNLPNIPSVELVLVGRQDYREILYEATLKCASDVKLKAGVVCESILDEQGFKSGFVVSESVLAHLGSLKEIALSFYDASCVISANYVGLYNLQVYGLDAEQVVLKNADLEALFKYSKLAIDESLEDYINDKGMIRLKAAAERGYGQAEALYGAVLYGEGEYQTSLVYLTRAEEKDELLALQFLYYAYSEGKACEQDFTLAIKYLNHAIELGCPDSLAILGAAHHKGEVVVKDDEKAKFLLQKSIEKGSAYGKRYFVVEFNDIVGFMMDHFKALGKLVTDSKMKPVVSTKNIKRNDPCSCGSGIKYKKCCGFDDKNSQLKERVIKEFKRS